MTDSYFPLVSVCVPNFNYAHYLGECLESILDQTYQNIEVFFRDNNSTDNSFEIAYEYRKKFMNRNIFFSIAENKFNLGSDRNSKLASRDATGDYIYTLASDDRIKPDFIERFVEIFTNNPEVSTVICHREEIDENGITKKTAPFYNQNCIIPGEEQANVYMVAGIAVPGQRMVRKSILGSAGPFYKNFQVAGDWYDNFLYSCFGDVAYILDDLFQYRVHSSNETNDSERKLLGIFEHYQLIHAFCEVSKAVGYKKPQLRYQEAIEKFSKMCIRYAYKMHSNNLNNIAVQYLNLASIFDSKILNNYNYQLLSSVTEKDQTIINQALKTIGEENVIRTCSYDPPPGSIRINNKGKKIHI